MSKRSLHHSWTQLRKVKPLYIFASAAIFFSIGLLALRQNNLNALRLRDELLQVDKENGDVESALRELRQYTYSHMNTDLSDGSGLSQPVQLVYTYQRLQQAEEQRVSAINEKIYNDAQKVCEAQGPGGFSGRNRVPCIEAYVTSREVKQREIPDSLYKFDFASPRWSPDLAGVSLLIAWLLLGLGVTRIIAGYIIQRSLHRHA